jgi:hypothetical protein
MPRVARFSGIDIRIHHGDHPPPHFHAYAAGCMATIDIDSARLLEGRLPPRVRRLLIRWATRNRAALRAGWARAQSGARQLAIPPPE